MARWLPIGIVVLVLGGVLMFSDRLVDIWPSLRNPTDSVSPASRNLEPAPASTSAEARTLPHNGTSEELFAFITRGLASFSAGGQGPAMDIPSTVTFGLLFVDPSDPNGGERGAPGWREFSSAKVIDAQLRDVMWKDRTLPAAVLTLSIQFMNRSAGTRTEACLIVCGINDKDFQVWRDVSCYKCQDKDKLADWKLRTKFDAPSETAPDAAPPASAIIEDTVEGAVEGTVYIDNVPAGRGIVVNLRASDKGVGVGWITLFANTDDHGTFRFEHVEPGTYCALVTTGGIKPFETCEIRILPRQNTGPQGLPIMLRRLSSQTAASQPTATATTEDPLHVGGEVTEPIEIARTKPEYPEAARRARLQGIVLLEAIIDKDGAVRSVRVLSGIDPLLDTSAMRAVQEWKYRAATFRGHPVPVYLTVTVKYTLGE